MRLLILIVGTLGFAAAQFPGGPNPPPGAWGGGNRPSGYPKQPQPPGRPSPFSALTGVLPGSSSSGVNAPPSYDDPIPQIPHDSTYDTQTLPAKLPILAPNGVVEIYNRVVDDLIKRLEGDFGKKKMDPMPVIIRPTPAGPVRVPGYLQRRPFRRPGAALYRTGAVVPEPPSFGAGGLKKKKSRSNPLPETRFPEGGRPSVSAAAPSDDKVNVRGSGKISKGPLSNEEAVPETTPLAAESVEVPVKNVSTEAPPAKAEAADAASSEEEPEEGLFIRSRSEEWISDDHEDDDDHKSAEVVPSTKTKKTKKDDTEEDDEDEKIQNKANEEKLLERYSTKNTKSKGSKGSSSGSSSKSSSKSSEKPVKITKPIIKSQESEDDDDEEDVEVRDDMDDDVSFDAEPGTGGGGRPNGGYYPPGGPPAIPAKPNAVMTGLSKIRRASDVAVSVDARSAMITARLLVGPLNIYVNDSSEPKERGLKATIPELEAEIILMERHGVVFLQRFTLDRAYGQDVEISIPKTKGSSKKNKNTSSQPPNYGPGGLGGPNNPASEDRYRTKMAAHMSMEVVKLLRSGNLRVNLMRTAQGSMSKLKLPIVKPKTKKPKKERRNNKDDDSGEKEN